MRLRTLVTSASVAVLGLNGVGKSTLFGCILGFLRPSAGKITTILYRCAKAEPAAGAAPFTDVPAGECYSDAVARAEANGITTGNKNNEFSPLKTCSRVETVTFCKEPHEEDGL